MGINADLILAEIAAGVQVLLTILESYDIVEVSRRYYDDYSEKSAHYHSQFRVGYERQFLSDVWAVYDPTYNYAEHAAFALVAMRSDTAMLPNGYNPPFVQTYLPEFVAATADLTVSLFRYEDQRVRLESDIRWERRLNTLNVGIGLANDVRGGMAASTQFLDVAYGRLNDWGATLGNNLLMARGASAGFAANTGRGPTTLRPVARPSDTIFNAGD